MTSRSGRKPLFIWCVMTEYQRETTWLTIALTWNESKQRWEEYRHQHHGRLKYALEWAEDHLRAGRKVEIVPPETVGVS